MNYFFVYGATHIHRRLPAVCLPHLSEIQYRRPPSPGCDRYHATSTPSKTVRCVPSMLRSQRVSLEERNPSCTVVRFLREACTPILALSSLILDSQEGAVYMSELIFNFSFTFRFCFFLDMSSACVFLVYSSERSRCRSICMLSSGTECSFSPLC